MHNLFNLNFSLLDLNSIWTISHGRKKEKRKNNNRLYDVKALLLCFTEYLMLICSTVNTWELCKSRKHNLISLTNAVLSNYRQNVMITFFLNDTIACD